jgi:hypothetical protein
VNVRSSRLERGADNDNRLHLGAWLVVVSRGFVDQRFEANLFHLHLVLRHGLLVVVCRVSGVCSSWSSSSFGTGRQAPLTPKAVVQVRGLVVLREGGSASAHR